MMRTRRIIGGAKRQLKEDLRHPLRHPERTLLMGLGMLVGGVNSAARYAAGAAMYHADPQAGVFDDEARGELRSHHWLVVVP